MMMVATVRRRVACDLLVVALLCCCCVSICVTAAATGVDSSAALGKVWVEVDVSCALTDGKLNWRPSGETSWRTCASRLGVDEGGNDDCARLCYDAGEFYNDTTITNRCSSGGAQNTVAFTMRVATYGKRELCSPSAAKKNAETAGGTAQQPQLGPQTAAEAASPRAVTTTLPGADTLPPPEADTPPPPEADTLPPPEADILTPADGGLARSDVNGPTGQAAAAPQKGPLDGADNGGDTSQRSASRAVTWMQDPGNADSSDATTVWVRTPLVLLVTALVCAAVR